MKIKNLIATTFDIAQKIPLTFKTENISKISGVIFGELLSIMKQKETILNIVDYLPYLDGRTISRILNIEYDYIEEINMMLIIWDQDNQKLQLVQKMIQDLYSYSIGLDVLQRLLQALQKDINNHKNIFKELKLEQLSENIKAKIGDRKLKALKISINYVQNITFKTTQTKIDDKETNIEVKNIIDTSNI